VNVIEPLTQRLMGVKVTFSLRGQAPSEGGGLAQAPPH
jgi:hypothetical protein